MEVRRPEDGCRLLRARRLRQYLVTLDETYFDPKRPRSAPQFFVVSFCQRGLPETLPPAMGGLRDEALARFDYDALAALLARH